eukprot:TRINITY_DN9960_c0_g1_i4.p1 TRINITY_DN9960_c0_g1~~TRINITY_DN9960_c0_g1_i4.p1  ORF type:complete len:439 (+),score=-51.24 TRINITY_DN9960_c0_g1_i4:396-1712(+)
MLLHLTNPKGDDIIAYWVEFGEGAIRWLYMNVTKNELYLYLSRKTTLKYLLENTKNQYVFFVDVNATGETIAVSMISSYEIPTNYIPGENSYYIGELTEFYLNYLDEIDYHQNLIDQGYIIHGIPAERQHSTYLTAKEGALILSNISSSAEGYVTIKAKSKYQNKFTSQSRINKIARDIKNHLTPLITGAAIHSFEVWVSMDTLTLNGLDETGNELKREVIDGYKKDVLDIDFSSEIDANLICEKFNPIERKIIYGPIIELLDNPNLKITISDKKKTIRETSKPVKISDGFRKKVLPPPTVEELLADKEKKKRIYTLVFSLEEGANLSNVTKKQIVDNLLMFGNDEHDYPINSPIKTNGFVFKLKKPIPGTIKVLDDGSLQLTSFDFNIDVKGTDMALMRVELEQQFYNFIRPYLEKRKEDNQTLSFLNEYLDLEAYQ